jgi:hypothetical protein
MVIWGIRESYTQKLRETIAERNLASFCLLMQSKSFGYRCVSRHISGQDTDHSSQYRYCPAKIGISAQVGKLLVCLVRNVLYDLEKAGTFSVPNRICRDTGKDLCKIHKIWTFPRKSNWDPYLRAGCCTGQVTV